MAFLLLSFIKIVIITNLPGTVGDKLHSHLCSIGAHANNGIVVFNRITIFRMLLFMNYQ